MLWGFASRSEKEDGLHEREGCPREPGLQAGEEPVAPDAACSCCGNPAQAAAAVLRVPRGERGSVRGLKGPIHRSQSHSGIRATQLGCTIHLSHSTLAMECDSPCPYRLRCPHGFESTKGICYFLLWFSFRATPRWNKENSIRP